MQDHPTGGGNEGDGDEIAGDGGAATEDGADEEEQGEQQREVGEHLPHAVEEPGHRGEEPPDGAREAGRRDGRCADRDERQRGTDQRDDIGGPSRARRIGRGRERAERTRGCPSLSPSHARRDHQRGTVGPLRDNLCVSIASGGCRSVEWTGSFDWRGATGTVQVECIPNDDPDEYGTPVSAAVGFPVCTATVRYPRRGYNAMFGWVQLVRSTDNASAGERFEMDPFGLFADAPSPYCWFGTEPTLFDAPLAPRPRADRVARLQLPCHDTAR